MSTHHHGITYMQLLVFSHYRPIDRLMYALILCPIPSHFLFSFRFLLSFLSLLLPWAASTKRAQSKAWITKSIPLDLPLMSLTIEVVYFYKNLKIFQQANNKKSLPSVLVWQWHPFGLLLWPANALLRMAEWKATEATISNCHCLRFPSSASLLLYAHPLHPLWSYRPTSSLHCIPLPAFLCSFLSLSL